MNTHTIEVKVADRDDGSERWVVLFRMGSMPECLRTYSEILSMRPEVPVRMIYRPAKETA